MLNPFLKNSNNLKMFFIFLKNFRKIWLSLLAIFLGMSFLLKSVYANTTYWEIQSIDTMKFSRDLAREKKADLSFDREIEDQISQIAFLGATHVVLGTPYDEEFLPFLKRWVVMARKYGLKIWFRGNFSGWEGWFGYPRITPEQHIEETQEFILKNPDLFENGDIFTSCTECENGRVFDPFRADQLLEFRKFLIEEYKVAKRAFESLGKDVKTNFYPMNLDVAKLVMNKDTLNSLEKVVVLDHYVDTPQKLVNDIDEIHVQTNAKIVLGEIGVPIPDIHGEISEGRQAEWLSETLELLSYKDFLLGLNYWVNKGGSTEIFYKDGRLKPAGFVVKDYFKPVIYEGRIVNQFGIPVKNAEVNFLSKKIISDSKGHFLLPLVPSAQKISILADGYQKTEVQVKDLPKKDIVLVKDNLFFKIFSLIHVFLLQAFSKAFQE